MGEVFPPGAPVSVIELVVIGADVVTGGLGVVVGTSVGSGSVVSVEVSSSPSPIAVKKVRRSQLVSVAFELHGDIP